jgi:MFS family permease
MSGGASFRRLAMVPLPGNTNSAPEAPVPGRATADRALPRFQPFQRGVGTEPVVDKRTQLGVRQHQQLAEGDYGRRDLQADPWCHRQAQRKDTGTPSGKHRLQEPAQLSGVRPRRCRMAYYAQGEQPEPIDCGADWLGSGSMPETVTPLRRNRDFLLLWFGQAVAALGGSVAGVVYPLLALLATGSAAGAGAVAFAGLATGVLLRLPGGVLADRWPRKPVMVWAEAVRAVVTGTLVVAVLADRLTIAHLIVVTVVGSACAVCFEPAQTIAVRHVVPVSQLPLALAQNEARGHVAGLGGPPLGGFLFGLGPAAPLVAHALSYVVSAVSVAAIRRPMGTATGHGGGRIRDDLTAGARHVWRTPFLRVTLLVAAVFQFVFAGLGLTIIAVATTGGTAAVHIGAALSLAGVGGILGAWAAPFLQRRFSPAALVTGLGWTSVAGILPMARWSDVYLAGALLGAVYFVGTPANAMLVATQMAATPAHLQGRVISAAFLLAGFAAPLGPLVAGVVYDNVGRTATFATFVAVLLVCTVAMHRSRVIRQMARPVT